MPHYQNTEKKEKSVLDVNVKQELNSEVILKDTPMNNHIN